LNVHILLFFVLFRHSRKYFPLVTLRPSGFDVGTGGLHT